MIQMPVKISTKQISGSKFYSITQSVYVKSDLLNIFSIFRIKNSYNVKRND